MDRILALSDAAIVRGKISVPAAIPIEFINLYSGIYPCLLKVRQQANL